MDNVTWQDGKPFGPKNWGLDGADLSELEPLTEFPAKMSKSLKNVVNPDDVIRDYGADSLRLYEMFMGPLQAVKPWSTKGVEGVHRFLKRANRLVTETKTCDRPMTKAEAKSLSQMIKKVGEDVEALGFNTAISAMMVFVNEAEGYAKDGTSGGRTDGTSGGPAPLPKEFLEAFVLCLAPFAPHLGEELWQFLGHDKSLAYEPWPAFDPASGLGQAARPRPRPGGGDAGGDGGGGEGEPGRRALPRRQDDREGHGRPEAPRELRCKIGSPVPLRPDF